jgi:hypothetical protein
MNPFKMLSQLMGEAQLRKCYSYCALACCCVIIIAMLPMIFYDILGNILTKLIGL